MNKTSIVIALLAGIIIGLVGGQAFHNDGPERRGMHQMPDGSMMSNEMGNMMSGLSGKTSDDFDKAFLTEMIVHHEGAVDMAQAALKDAKHAEIKNMANAIISAQTGEIAQMKAWLKEWYGIDR